MYPADTYRDCRCVVCILFMATLAIAFKNFLPHRCREYTDDVINFGSYHDCVKRCQKSDVCVAVSFNQKMSVCKIHFREEGTLSECKGFAYSRKADWTPEPSECDSPLDCKSFEKTCQPQISPFRGMLLGNKFTEGQKVIVECNPGYIVNGSKQRKCASGSWSGEEATCVEDPLCVKPLLWGDEAENRRLSESANWCKTTSSAACEGGITLVSYLYSRLNSTGTMTGSWCPGARNISEFIQADFLYARTISAIVLQGRNKVYNIIQYVTKFTIKLSNDCINFETIKDESGVEKVFEGTSGPEDIVVRALPERRRTRCVRLHPQEWKNYPSLRWDIQGC